jgi:hypothetical protein
MQREIEEQAVQLRHDLSVEGALPEDFPIPYLTFGELRMPCLWAAPSNWAARSSMKMQVPGTHRYRFIFLLEDRFAGRIKSAINLRALRRIRFHRFSPIRSSSRAVGRTIHSAIRIVNPQFIEDPFPSGVYFHPAIRLAHLPVHRRGAVWLAQA